MRREVAVLCVGLCLLAVAAWEARRAADGGGLDAAARDEAARAASLFASLSAHLRASSGDPRFADRIPADPPIVAELLADVTFAQHQGLLERCQLVGFQVEGVEDRGHGMAEVRAREYWITEATSPAGATTRSDVVSVRYAMRHDAGGWRVADWTLGAGGPGGAGR